ncbi:MAG: cold shock domain-containing protein [Pseudomonadota bacterium]
MRTGTLKWFDTDKGYGFILPSDGGEDIFVRQAAFDAAGLGTAQGQALSFNVSRAPDGLQATDLSAR